jgi:hypothetical protein
MLRWEQREGKRKMHSMWHGGPRVEDHSPGWLQNKEMEVVCVSGANSSCNMFFFFFFSKWRNHI